MNGFLKMIDNHRSIRSFSNQTILQSELEKIISAAQYASTSNFIQAYSVIQVRDTEKRKLLAQYSGNQEYVEKASEFLVFCADLYRLHEAIKYNGYEPDFSTLENFILTTVDTALFAQNVMIGAESKGMGGVFIGGIRNNPEKVSELLELPELVIPLFGICLGYPDSNLPDKKTRLPLTAILHRDAYDKNKIDIIEAYDKNIQEYYIKRTNGKMKDTWSLKMAQLFSKPLRAHLRSFILKKGFKLD